MTTPAVALEVGGLSSIGVWSARAHLPAFEAAELLGILAHVREPAHIVREGERGRVGVGLGGEVMRSAREGGNAWPLLATLPALYPEWLGDRSFGETHRVRFPYVAGEMANGIATTRLVMAMGRAGMLGFFGAAGLGHERVEKAIDELERELGDRFSWGVNLIHSPNEAALEDRVADILIRRNVMRVSASAFMALTPAVVRCAAAGLSMDAAGRILRKRHVFAKISRSEVARRFMSPAPVDILQFLVGKGLLTVEEAKLAEKVPVAEDVTVEADSGGHTDNQALVALFPTILQLRDEIVAKHGFKRPIRVGAAGGLGTPAAVAAAFQLGAAYVLTGSINQSAVESGLSDEGKRMLAGAELPDVIMAPAADMFELGVKVQVLKRGTMFGVRALKLYETYVAHPSLEAIPADLRARLEKEVLGTTIDAIWADTKEFWSRRDPNEVAKAEANPRHQMALVFRWYLGKASRWAIEGDAARRLDYQIWCGPAMGAFNAWTKGSFLEDPKNRTAAQIALNLLEGAAVIARSQQLRSYGVPVPPEAFHFSPRPLV
jgi:trans-AT polyketide synthase/acyltransferase/oxidoreductase domain-containing protein